MTKFQGWLIIVVLCVIAGNGETLPLLQFIWAVISICAFLFAMKEEWPNG